jgi:hypothetical protein
MTLNAIGPRGDAAPSFSGASYARVRDGLRAFDGLADEVRRRQDALQHSPRTTPAVAAGTGLGAALAAYLATPAGQKNLHDFAGAAVALAQRLFAGGPEQLPLPLA